MSQLDWKATFPNLTLLEVTSKHTYGDDVPESTNDIEIFNGIK